MSSLSVSEKTFLFSLRDEFGAQGGWARCASNPPSAAIRSLVDRGFCRLAPELIGDLHLPSGRMMVGLTEAGLEVITLSLEDRQQVPEDDLAAIEKWVSGRSGNATIFPADAGTLAAMTLRLIKEVRAFRSVSMRAKTA